MKQKSIQDYNLVAEACLKELKTFFSLEKNGLAGMAFDRTVVNNVIVPILIFSKSVIKATLMTRLKEYGFPVPTIEGQTARFTDINKIRPITSGKNKHAIEALEITEKEIVYKKATEWLKQKGYKNRICLGPTFIRVQEKNMAKAIFSLLKTNFEGKYKFEIIHEDIFFWAKNQTKQNSVMANQSNPFREFLEHIFPEIFGIPIYGIEQEENMLILGFQTEEEVINAEFFCKECSLVCEIKGSTLVFEKPEKYPSYEDIQKICISLPPAESVVTPAPSQEEVDVPPKITEKDFFAEVRAYVYGLGYKPLKNTSMEKYTAYTYRMGIQGDLTKLMEHVVVDKPHWQVTKASEKSHWVRFALTGVVLVEDEKKTQAPLVEKTEGSRSEDFNLDLPKKILKQVEELQKASDPLNADNAQIKEALGLIIELGKRFGITYKEIMSSKKDSALPNRRYVKWDGTPKKIEDALSKFTNLGYGVHGTTKAIVFSSVFPLKVPLTVPVRKESGSNVAIVKQVQVQSEKKETEGIEIKMFISNDTMQSILKAVATEDLLSELKRRGDSTPLSDEELLETVRQRGPVFGKKLLQTILEYWQGA